MEHLFSFHDKTIVIDAKTWKMEHPISEAILLNNIVVVIYEPIAQEEKFRQFQNMVAFDLAGQKIWTAEHPTNTTNDCYINFVKTKPLTVWNFACYLCEIDPATGRIIKAQFTK